MAINKKLIHFNNKATFENELSNNNILNQSIVFIKDSNEIWTHGLYYSCKDWLDWIERIIGNLAVIDTDLFVKIPRANSIASSYMLFLESDTNALKDKAFKSGFKYLNPTTLETEYYVITKKDLFLKILNEYPPDETLKQTLVQVNPVSIEEIHNKFTSLKEVIKSIKTELYGLENKVISLEGVIKSIKTELYGLELSEDPGFFGQQGLIKRVEALENQTESYNNLLIREEVYSSNENSDKVVAYYCIPSKDSFIHVGPGNITDVITYYGHRDDLISNAITTYKKFDTSKPTFIWVYFQFEDVWALCNINWNENSILLEIPLEKGVSFEYPSRTIEVVSLLEETAGALSSLYDLIPLINQLFNTDSELHDRIDGIFNDYFDYIKDPEECVDLEQLFKFNINSNRFDYTPDKLFKTISLTSLSEKQSAQLSKLLNGFLAKGDHMQPKYYKYTGSIISIGLLETVSNWEASDWEPYYQPKVINELIKPLQEEVTLFEESTNTAFDELGEILYGYEPGGVFNTSEEDNEEILEETSEELVLRKGLIQSIIDNVDEVDNLENILCDKIPSQEIPHSDYLYFGEMDVELPSEIAHYTYNINFYSALIEKDFYLRDSVIISWSKDGLQLCYQLHCDRHLIIGPYALDGVTTNYSEINNCLETLDWERVYPIWQFIPKSNIEILRLENNIFDLFELLRGKANVGDSGPELVFTFEDVAEFEDALGAGFIADNSVVFIEETNQVWSNGNYYSMIPNNGHERQILTWKASGRAQWENLSDVFTGMVEFLAYGVEWDVNVADPRITRIGNMSLHKTLPIQSQLKGCIAQKDKVIYWLNEEDWRFRKDPTFLAVSNLAYSYVMTEPAEGEEAVETDEVESTTMTVTSLTGIAVNQYIKVGEVKAKITATDAEQLTITVDAEIPEDTTKVELGSRLDGYDGTVRVYCPNFYIKSEKEGNKRRVWLSTVNIDNTWTYQPEILLDAYRSTVLNTVPEDMGYLSTLPVNSAISVVNTNGYCRGGGNRTANDTYLTTDPCRSDLGKPRTNISRVTMRYYARKAGNEMLSYDQYKNIFYWLYVVEYANFNCQEAFNSALTGEGYHQGGMGAGVTTWDGGSWNRYNGYYPLTPCGYLNEFGNGTGIKEMTAGTKTFQVPRWRGFDNPFGDIWTNLDGIIIDADANNHPNNMNYVYTCQDTTKYADALNDGYEKVGEEIHQDGYTKLFDLGDAAHIIPHVIGGDTTKFKCDCHWTGSKNTTLRTLLVDGCTVDGAGAGLGFFYSDGGVSFSTAHVGFWSVSSFVSFPNN